jgi:phosphoglycolate phosphatase-like HAD superfamily hydrolase
MPDDPLHSWNEGPAKAALLDFIARVTTPNSRDFVAPLERIATFDNDGTLWCEYPMQGQVFFAQARLQALADKDPTLRERQPFKAFLEQDLQAIHHLGKKAVFEMAFMTHAGKTEEEFDAIARAWLATARHPKLGRLFKRCLYRPQIELLELLRQCSFKSYIVSGGGVDLIRAFCEEAYGIPREQVIGSSLRTAFEIQDGHGVLRKLPELNTFDDREVKVENIGLHIGRRPLLAFGNSDGDLAMLRYACSGTGARLALLLHHDDGDREFAYDRDFRLSPLADALDRADQYGLRVVSMRRDWSVVFTADT